MFKVYSKRTHQSKPCLVEVYYLKETAKKTNPLPLVSESRLVYEAQSPTSFLVVKTEGMRPFKVQSLWLMYDLKGG